MVLVVVVVVYKVLSFLDDPGTQTVHELLQKLKYNKPTTTTVIINNRDSKSNNNDDV